MFTPQDEVFMQIAIDASQTAIDAGDMPFGAVLASADGVGLLVARNNQVTSGDCTGHAEMVLVREATRLLGAKSMEGSTVYASGEPCAMCSAAIFYTGIGRAVYGLSAGAILHLRNAQPHTAGLSLSCRAVLDSAAERVEVIGPCLEEEGAVPHKGYWQEGAA